VTKINFLKARRWRAFKKTSSKYSYSNVSFVLYIKPMEILAALRAAILSLGFAFVLTQSTAAILCKSMSIS
jgi:hypothetical protein